MRENCTYGSMRGRAYPITRGVPLYSTPSDSDSEDKTEDTFEDKLSSEDNSEDSSEASRPKVNELSESKPSDCL